MKCPICRKRTPGFPDKCASCGGPILSPWRDYYTMLLYPGVILVLNGPLLVEGALENDDLLRFIFGIFSLVVGVYLVVLGVIVRRRRSRRKDD